MIYDIIIVGGGPIGLTCGIEATKKGLSYLIIEKGCLVNSIYNFPSNMTFFSTFSIFVSFWWGFFGGSFLFCPFSSNFVYLENL